MRVEQNQTYMVDKYTAIEVRTSVSDLVVSSKPGVSSSVI